jgi:hypothetical protein
MPPTSVKRPVWRVSQTAKQNAPLQRQLQRSALRSTSLAAQVHIDRNQHRDHYDDPKDKDDRLCHLLFFDSRLPSERIAGTQRPI